MGIFLKSMQNKVVSTCTKFLILGQGGTLMSSEIEKRFYDIL